LALGAQQIAVALAKRLDMASVYQCDSTPAADEIAASLTSAKSRGERTAVFLGELALNAVHVAHIEAAAAEIARLLNAHWGRFAAQGNTVGAMVVGVNQESTATILAAQKKAFVLWNNEPELDSAFGHEAIAAMQSADMVVYANSFDSAAARAYADVLLPIAPFTETAGTYINMAGTAQSVQAVVRPQGDSRPGWKVLRVLGELLGAKDVAFDTVEAVRDSVTLEALSNNTAAPENVPNETGVLRIATTPIYFADSLCRNAYSLQKTVHAKVPQAVMNAATAKQHGLEEGMLVEVTQGQGTAKLSVQINAMVADQAVLIALGHAATSMLGQGGVSLKKVSGA
jgi:NADH-quinone oxidoreductase subunit G